MNITFVYSNGKRDIYPFTSKETFLEAQNILAQMIEHEAKWVMFYGDFIQVSHIVKVEVPAHYA
jgi:hypothetical protein